MIISYLLMNQPFGIDAGGVFKFRLILSVAILFLSSLVNLRAETVVPLITPTQQSTENKTEAAPDLGFGPMKKDTSTNAPLGEGLGIIPTDPNVDALVNDHLDPILPIDPIILESEPSTDIPLELLGSENDLLVDDSLPSSDFIYQPWMPNGGSFNSGISRGLFSGFSNSPGTIPLSGSLLDDLGKGFSFSAALNGTYDSNPSQGYSTPADSDRGDYFTTFGGTLAYRSAASTWTYAAKYSGAYNQYLNQTNLSGYSQNASASLNYESGPVSSGIALGVNYGSGANRNYASVVDEISYIYAMNARYRVSAKTSLTGNFSYSNSDASGGSNTGSMDIGLSALWHYSPLTEFGPGVRYTQRSGDLQQDRTTIGPTLALNYKLSTKISLESAIGIDFVSYDGGGSSDTSLFASIGLNYRASSLWWLSFSLLRDSQASYSTVNEFEETTALRLGYNRKIRRALWTLGMGWETRTSENPTLAPTQPDKDYLTLDTGLSMPIFSGSTNGSIFLRYSEQNGGNVDSWDSFQLGFGINRSF